jgi:hypothetical protein
MKPITPQEVIEHKIKEIPDEVIDVWNKIIVEKWRESAAIVYKDEITKRIANTLNIDVNKVYDFGYLDIKVIYKNFGWNVEYYKPYFDESFRPYFTFIKA